MDVTVGPRHHQEHLLKLGLRLTLIRETVLSLKMLKMLTFLVLSDTIIAEPRAPGLETVVNHLSSLVLPPQLFCPPVLGLRAPPH